MLDRLQQDLKAAMLAREQTRVATLQGLKAAIKNAEIEKKSPLSEEEIVNVLRKQAKQRQEAIELYKKGGDEQRAAKEAEEKAVIEAYLPAQLDEASVAKLVDEAIAEMGTDNIGQIIGVVIKKSGGQADGSLVSKIVREKLGNT